MLKTAAAAVIAATTSISASSAIAAEQGWGFRFLYDAFSEKMIPMAVMQETVEGSSIDNASLLLVCIDDSVRVAFQSGFMMFGNSAEASFRGQEGIITAAFSSAEIPGFGTYLAASAGTSDALIAALSSGEPTLPFQSNEKRGTFTTVGFVAVLGFVREWCGGDQPSASSTQ